MKATELRIGNIVTVDNPKYHPQLNGSSLRVTGIKELIISNEIEYSLQLEHVTKRVNTYYQIYSQFMEYIKPVALTEQWLLDFGFVKKHVDFRTQSNSTAYNGGILKLSDFTVYLDKSEIEWAYRATVLDAPKYAHQVQNLYFALMQEELFLKERSEK